VGNRRSENKRGGKAEILGEGGETFSGGGENKWVGKVKKVGGGGKEKKRFSTRKKGRSFYCRGSKKKWVFQIKRREGERGRVRDGARGSVVCQELVTNYLKPKKKKTKKGPGQKKIKSPREKCRSGWGGRRNEKVRSRGEAMKRKEKVYQKKLKNQQRIL